MEEEEVLRLDGQPIEICPNQVIRRVSYHEKLNVILVGTAEGNLFVVDPTLGEPVYSTKLGVEEENCETRWDFNVLPEKLVVIEKNKVGIRSDYNGILLLSSILQTPLGSSSDVIQIELSKSEAESLCHSLPTADSVETDVSEVEKQLKATVFRELEPGTPLIIVKREKWSTVKLELPYSVLKSTFQTMVNELWKKNAYIPQLSIASSILERLNMLLPPSKPELDAPLEKSQMFSESARLRTFSNWPHMEYRWALPEKMAQAGFYHSPSSNGDDRAMCFTCNVCLVSWEPTDEPWSEHERHSPFCPFVRGEHTHNVPLSLSFATAPAFVVTEKGNSSPILAKSSCPAAVVVAYSNGHIVVWDVVREAKPVIRFTITSDVLSSTAVNGETIYCDVEGKPKSEVNLDSVIQGTFATVGYSSNQESVNLTAVAVIGVPGSLGDTKKSLPPSVVVGGNVFKSPTDANIPFILIYGLSPNTITINDRSSSPPEAPLKTSGRTGTKQENQHFEEDIFSYISDGDMLSDSISIFSDMNMSDTSGTFVVDASGIIVGGNQTAVSKKKLSSTQASQAQSKGIDNNLKNKTESKLKEKEIVLVQRIDLPNDLKHCALARDILPTLDGEKVVVCLEASNKQEEVVFGALIVHQVICESEMLKLEKQPVAIRKFISNDEVPVNLCVIPPDFEESTLACILRSGALCILKVNDLSLLKKIKRPDSDPHLTSISYVSSLERLCCGTSRGTLEMYTLNSADMDLGDEASFASDVNDSPRLNVDAVTVGVDASNLIVNQQLSLCSMKQLLQLTSFDNIKPCFAVNVSPCWVRIIQAQKDRKHPQHLQHQDSEVSESTLSWRLQRTKNSKKEHLFEITLPKSARVGHLDLKFSLQPGCVTLPAIEVTLYRALKIKPKLSPSTSDFRSQLKTKAASNEFLKSINAVPVCGPLELGSNLDLSGQGGNVVLTSPTLVLNKGRNFYLHIRAKLLAKAESTESSTAGTNGKEAKSESLKATTSGSITKVLVKKVTEDSTLKPLKVKSKPHANAFQNFPKLQGSALTLKFSKEGTPFYELTPFGSQLTTSGQPSSGASGSIDVEGEKRKEYYLGCDWLHEVSVTIRKVKSASIPLEDHERKEMLTSERLFSRLLDVAVFNGEENSYSAQSTALDLLVWIAAINLCGPQIGNTSYQVKFIEAVKQKLSPLILHGIIFADRSTAHKCAKLLVLCIDAVEFYGAEDREEPFLTVLLKDVLKLLPYTISCNSAGSLQWFFLILNRVRNENLSLAGETLLELLKDVSKELNRRNDSMHSLLRTRFGLYGTPFEQELFEVEVPPFTKSYSHPLTYAGLCTSEGANTLGSGTFHLWGLKDVDFRDLLVSNPLNIRWGKIGALSPKQQIHGLLEVEPLHFTCHAASDGTRVEKIDLGTSTSSFSAVPLPQPWEPFTNLPTGEGSKKSEPDKVDQIMMLQKALKMDSADAYYDVLSDLKFMGNNVNMLELPYNNAPHEDIVHIPTIDPSTWKNAAGVLTMVMQPLLDVSSNPTTSSANMVYNSFIPPPPLNQHMGVSSAFLHKPSTPPVVTTAPGSALNSSAGSKSPSATITQLSAASAGTSNEASTKVGVSGQHDTGVKMENDGLRLLLSPWQQMMYVPPQQALVIDRMHSGARRFVVLDFGSPILLTDMIIPACSDLVSLSIDIWLHREDTDGQRLVVASDIGSRSLVICDLQPPPVCRYLKLTTIGRYGMGTTRCRIPLGMFYGHSTVLPSDLRSTEGNTPADVTMLSPTNVQAHLSVLSYLVEDIGCRYQLACTKLRRLLEPLMKPDISRLDHMSYYLPKGKERNKLGLNTSSDQAVLSSYQECITLQQQLNVATNVMKRLQKCMSQTPSFDVQLNPHKTLPDICTDKVHVLTEFLIESLLGISFLASNSSLSTTPIPYSLYTSMTLETCEALFKEICVLENGQCQLSLCTLMLRVCGCQPWWGKFLASAIKALFCSNQTSIFPQDRVFILLVYLGQKSLLSAQNTSVLENAMELLAELLSPIEDHNSFLRSKVDMTLIGWVVMYLCLCLDGVNCTLTSTSQTSTGTSINKNKEKDVSCVSSRWDFIQGESALYRRSTGSSRMSSNGGFKRRIQKKLMATKQKLEELDNVAAGLGYASQMQTLGGLGNKLSALGNQIEAIKQKQASLGKSIKIQGSKHFKDLIQIRRSELLSKRGLLSGKDVKEDCGTQQDVEINLSLSQSLCLTVTKGLGTLLLKMDSTCHSDVYLIVSKALAKIATCCRPSIPLGAIFEVGQLVTLICGSCGSDYVRERNWSSSWVSHATMCLIQDVLEGEKLYPTRNENATINTCDTGITDDIMSEVAEDDVQVQQMQVEDMCVDSVDGDGGGISDVATMESTVSLDSEDSDFEDIEVIEFGMLTDSKCPGTNGTGKRSTGLPKKLSPCTTSISSALDARLESGVESTTEIRLRMMSVVDSEVLSQCLKAPVEVPAEILKNMPPVKKHSMQEPVAYSVAPSQQLLASCFDDIFNMMASENCSLNIAKVLQLWITINTEYPTVEETHNVKPVIPLSCKSLSSLMSALTKNASVGIQEWGLAFQCLSLAANQRTLNSTTGHWLYIMTDKYFPEIILKFISGAGINVQKNHVVSAGPTVCQHFYNFLLRLRQLSNDTIWTPCLKEVLLRVLAAFLSGPFLYSDFPLDAFNKFLDRVTCPDLSYENPTTIVSIIQSFASALHRFVFFPSKLNIRSPAELKAGTAGAIGSAIGGASLDTKAGKGQTLDMTMFRLVTFMASVVSLPYKKFLDNGLDVHEFLKNMTLTSTFTEYESKLTEYVAKCENTHPRTIADIVLQMEPAMMRILSVLAHPNGINVLVSGDLSSAFNILDTAAPATVVDAVIHLFSKLHANCSQPEWMIRPVCRFLSTSPYDDFYCPLVVSETFVLMVLKVISKEEYLKVFTEMKCVEAVCEKLVNSTRKFINSCPTFVSILTQYIGRTDGNALFGQKKYSGESLELQDGLINVAPLGVITSTNFSAHPSEVLLQSTPPHRRARTPVWSYHFFPEESYLELVVTLPCAVLLKEVQIVPHMTSLSTACPSAVMVEVSRERSNMTLPMGPPVQCGGLSNISIQLTQPEVAQTVLLRLFKPKDSNNLGLSQIRLLGSTTFSEAALQGLSSGDNSRSLETSAHWMYILDRAIDTAERNPQLYHQIIETAVTIPEMMECCYSALVAPIASRKTNDVSLSHVASVLFHFGKYHKDVSEQLISALIGPVQLGLSHGMSANANTLGSNGHSQLNTVVELLYKLCCNIPDWGHVNLLAVIRWLENCADEALSNACSFRASGAVPEYIQAVSAALWSVAAAGKVDLTNIATPYLLKKLYNWSLKLEPKSELKSIVDHMICSVCFCQPWLFVYLMHSMNLIKVAEGIDLTGSCFADLLQQWYDEGSVWGRVEVRDVQSLKVDLHPSVLLTLGRAAQSPAAANNLKISNLLDTLNVAIMDFWNFYSASTWMGASSVFGETKIITSVQFVGILTFYGELCKVNDFKNWFGTNGAGFWLPLLNLLSTLPGSLKSSFFGTYVYDIESTVINFLAKCCWTHPENQKKIASCLREIILKQKSTPHKAVFLHSMSSFCRRLLIQLLLENEKIVVHVKSSCKYSLKVPASTLPLKDRHPCMGVKGCDRVFFAGTQSTAYEMLRLIEPIGMKLDKSGNASEATKPSAANKRDGLVEAGLEMIDQIFGTVAKDKRVAADQKRLIKTASKKLKPDSVSESKSVSEITETKKGPKLVLELEEFPEVKVPLPLPINTVLAAVQSRLPFLDVLVFSLRTELSGMSSGDLSPSSSSQSMAETDDSGQGRKEKRTRRIPDVFNVSPVPATIEVFSRMGGLGLLAKHLPVVYPDTLRQIAVGTKFTSSVGVVMSMDKDSPITMHNDADWVKIESADDFYDDMMESIVASSTPIPKKNAAFRHFSPTPGIPPHSMAAFGLFLSLPRFSEVLLGERVGAQCMLRLVMGVTDDADGNDIFGTAVAKTLPTLPFQVLRCLLEILPLSIEEGRHLRRAMVEYKAIHFILACLAVFTHQICDPSLVPGLQHELVIAATKAQGGYEKNSKSDDKSHVYWAKGTGFGTGSTAQSWDVELALQKKRAEEENVTCLLHVLSSYINPQTSKPTDDGKAMDSSPSSSDDDMNLPPEISLLLRNSCLFYAISGYLRNDSVLDMARHVPLYKAVLQFLRSLVSSCQLLPLLAPGEKKSSSSDEQSIPALLGKMKDVVDNYARRLTVNTKGKTKSKQTTKVEDLEDEGLALLIPDIQSTASLVEIAVNELIKRQGPQDVEMGEDGGDGSLAVPPKTPEERYIEEMKKLQFAFYEMIVEEEDTGGIRFVVPYHYETNVRTNWGRAFPARLKRLAQESVTLSSSLPIAYGSTIFIRCDNDRLDVMKVLITGPSGTPYSNGCFEFDVFFPNDYPSSPMLINLETTGRQRIRFNPNLYTDGKVCLSILNTWHGRPEEKWNPQTSSLLPVLVAIQSLILNAEPYFNEPGYEKSRGTDAGERSSREYNAGIQIATVEWAMLDQLRNPSPCFKEIVQKHFWMKKGEILNQCEQWLEDLVVTCKTDKRAGKNVTGGADPVAVFKNNLSLLKKELINLKPPEGLEGLADRAPRKSPSDAAVAMGLVTSLSSPSASASGSNPSIFVHSSRISGEAAIASASEIKCDVSSVGHINLSGPTLTPDEGLPPINQKIEFVDALEPITVTVVDAGDPMDEDDKVPMDI
ncbi:unnamed protein product [Orchesella dallaii]|uniref:UBC core domain-containing protein n=1 Tax=Orchesella dallaii TaxID=48710 RepID=A0ABP1QWR0_9HEXA